MNLTEEVIKVCQAKLVEMKRDLLNRAKVSRLEFMANDKNSGDEVDQTNALLAENHILSVNERIRFQLFEIENALAKIESGTYGICEETEEPIETLRLLAIPYTRLSIEGAEIREAFTKVFA